MKYNIDSVIEFILVGQNEDGSFNTYELYPVVKPQDDWSKLADSSPFISANILHALMMTENPSIQSNIEKGGLNLLHHKERGDYWRFWPLKSKQHPVALDVDDTSICSFVLQKLGYKLNNKKVLSYNINEKGYFNTWIQPTWRILLSNPILYFGLVHDYNLSKPTVAAAEFSFDDYEPAVAANVLLYMGDNIQTRLCMQLIIEEIRNSKIKLEFYADEVIVYYHVARAFANGVEYLGTLSEVITSRIEKRFSKNQKIETNLHKALAASVLGYFQSSSLLASKLIEEISNTCGKNNDWKCEPYFASKDRNFLAGSPELTAAFFVEACTIHNNLQMSANNKSI